jgi:hypothetical protein
MPTDEQRANRRAYMKKYTARKRKEALAVARDTEIVEMVHAKRAAKRPAAPIEISTSGIIAALQRISYVVQESGAMQAVFTWPDGATVTIDSTGAIVCRTPVLS